MADAQRTIREGRIRALPASPDFLDRIGPEMEAVPGGAPETWLPPDATPCGLSFDPGRDRFRVLIASETFDPTPEGDVYPDQPDVSYIRAPGAPPDPFLSRLDNFLSRARASVTVRSALTDVVILPRRYVLDRTDDSRGAGNG